MKKEVINLSSTDRVLVRSDGKSTYFLSDIAYHLEKLERLGIETNGEEWVIFLKNKEGEYCKT